MEATLDFCLRHTVSYVVDVVYYRGIISFVSLLAFNRYQFHRAVIDNIDKD